MSTVKYLLPSQKVPMGDGFVDQPFPTQKIQQLDPFLLLHHHKSRVKKGYHPREQGVGPHPHRGFSPVTFIFKGDVHHRDSCGNSHIVSAGGIQWVKAGMGIIHSERPSLDLTKSGGEQEIIQLWINSPAKNKFDTPSYQAFQEKEIPTVIEKSSITQVVAGALQEVKGPVKTDTDINAFVVHFTEDGGWDFRIPKDHSSLVYTVKNNVQFRGMGLVDEKTAIVTKGDHMHFEAKKGSVVLVLTGLPIDEKVTQYGPYVMNTQTEVLEAMRDYQMGKMGILIEEF